MLSPELLQEHIGQEVLEVKKLNGYFNVNYLLKTADDCFVFKTYVFDQDLYESLEAESEMLLKLQKCNADSFPLPIPFKDGSFSKVLEVNSKPTICRILTFLEGDLLGDIKPFISCYESLGTFLAEMDLALGNYKSNAIKAKQTQWDIQYLSLNEPLLKAITNSHNRSMVQYFMFQYKEKVVPKVSLLRQQIIHNDANEWNLLTKGNEISGIIDFGDMVHSFLINELAVALTYAAYDKEELLPWMLPVLKAYHQKFPLLEVEIEVLYYLIAARLCISVCNSAQSKLDDPENAYATSSEENAWKMLHQWLALNPIGVERAFKKSLDFEVLKPESTELKLKRRFSSVSSILSVSYKRPVSMTGAAFQYMYDEEGNAILDAYNNIPHVGHSHPRVVEAGQRQMATLNTNTRYLYDLLPRYAEKLLAKFPKTLSKVFFVNSGSAASDLAIRLAQAHTRNKNVVVMEHGYHGNTQIGIDVSDYKFNNRKGQGQKEHILKVPLPEVYRGKYSGEDAGETYAKEALDVFSNSEIAAFIVEPIVGCGGQVPLALGYLKALYPQIRKLGGLCIIDEVQTGFGRVGTHFWGFEQHDVVPDIVILGKPIANGHPMGAVVCTEEVANSFEQGVEFFSSFGGNPVSCAIAEAVLDVIEEEQLQENALEVGNYYMEKLNELKSKFPKIGDVRGSGLFIGIELIKDEKKTPHTALAQYLKNGMRERNILISTDGPFDSVLKTKPPLCFTKENAKTVVENLEELLLEYDD